jgi:L-seryl-tRNA(Ser) seleniumtransferase
VRTDKLTLAALEATLLQPGTPTRLALRADPGTLRDRAGHLADRLSTAGVRAEVVDSAGAVGGGGAPEVRLPSAAVALDEGLATRLRTGDPPVVGRVEKGRLLLDLRCVPEDSDAVMLAAVIAAHEERATS